MSLYKSGSSNLPQVFCHSKLNMAIKECLLLNIKIQQNKPSCLSPSCLHAESLVTTDFPHRYPCTPRSGVGTKPVVQQEYREWHRWGLRQRNCPSLFPRVCFCSARPSRAQLPVPTDSPGDELPKSTTEKIQTVNSWAWSWLSAQPLCSLPRPLNQKQTRFRHRPREMQALSRSRERVSTAQDSTRPLQVMRHRQNPVCKDFLARKTEFT